MNLKKGHEGFLKFLESAQRAPATILAYGKDVEQLNLFLESRGVNDFNSINSEHLSLFLKNLGRGYTLKSVSRKINSLKTFFNFLKEKRIIENNPALNIKHPKLSAKAPRILSRLEYRALRDACREDCRASTLVEILLQTGIRISELANIKLDDIKEDVLFIPKLSNYSERKIPLNKAAVLALKKYLGGRPKSSDAHLFITRSGKPLLVRNIRTVIDRYFKTAGINEVKVNDLRHTFIAHHLSNGVPVETVNKLVGHKAISTTEKYLKYISVRQEKKLKLEEI